MKKFLYEVEWGGSFSHLKRDVLPQKTQKAGTSINYCTFLMFMTSNTSPPFKKGVIQ